VAELGSFGNRYTSNGLNGTGGWLERLGGCTVRHHSPPVLCQVAARGAHGARRPQGP
jgi:hypothetical protein